MINVYWFLPPPSSSSSPISLCIFFLLYLLFFCFFVLNQLIFCQYTEFEWLLIGYTWKAFEAILPMEFFVVVAVFCFSLTNHLGDKNTAPTFFILIALYNSRLWALRKRNHIFLQYWFPMTHLNLSKKEKTRTHPCYADFYEYETAQCSPAHTHTEELSGKVLTDVRLRKMCEDNNNIVYKSHCT